jgi:hypothetical protein
MAARTEKTGNFPLLEDVNRIHNVKCNVVPSTAGSIMMDALMNIGDLDFVKFPQSLMMLGIAVGMNKGHVVRRRELPPRPSRRKGTLSQKTKAVRSLIKEVCG